MYSIDLDFNKRERDFFYAILSYSRSTDVVGTRDFIGFLRYSIEILCDLCNTFDDCSIIY